MVWLLELLVKMVPPAAAAVCAWVAVQGLTTWRRQLLGNAEYDLARRLLRAVFRVRDQIAYVRGPFVSAGEITEAYKKAGIPLDSIDYLNDGARRDQLVYGQRWEPLAAAVSDLAVETVEGEVIWGPRIRELAQDLNRTVVELNVALQMYIRESHSGRTPDDAALARFQRNEKIVFFQGAEDPFDGRVMTAVSAFEAELRPHVRSPSVSITTRDA